MKPSQYAALVASVLAMFLSTAQAQLDFDVPSATSQTFSNNFTNYALSNLAITKTGAGTLIMQRTGDQVVTGSTTIQQGTVVLSRTVGLQNRDLPNGTIFVASGATLVNAVANQIGDATAVTLSNSTLTFNGAEYFGGLTLRDNALVNGDKVFVLNGTQSAGFNAVGGGTAGVVSAPVALASSFSDGSTANSPRQGNGTTPFFVDTGTSLTVSSTIFDGFQSSPIGSLSKSGAGTLILNGNGEYRGTTTVTAGELRINGTMQAYFWNGSAMVYSNAGTLSVTNASVVINGTNTGSTVVNAGGKVSGSGSLGGLIVNSGGTLSPGSSPGTLTATNAVWNAGGNYNWQIYNAAGTQGTGWDLFSVTGPLDLSALSVGSEFNINLWSLSSTGPDVSGALSGFDANQSYTWTILTASGGITGYSGTGQFAINTTAINGTDGFANALASGWGFSVVQAGNNLNLVYASAPIPEPGTWAAMAVLAGGAALARWRRRGLLVLADVSHQDSENTETY